MSENEEQRLKLLCILLNDQREQLETVEENIKRIEGNLRTIGDRFIEDFLWNDKENNE